MGSIIRFGPRIGGSDKAGSQDYGGAMAVLAAAVLIAGAVVTGVGPEARSKAFVSPER